MIKQVLLASMTGLFAVTAGAADIQLPAPVQTGGTPLMTAIGARRSERSFDATHSLSPQTLSDLLWATWGISSPDGRRTVPTARNLQNIDLYVALGDGVYLYQAAQNKLQKITDNDVRPLLAGQQTFALSAPVHLLFVAEPDEMGWAAMHAGSMYQNAGLFCAAKHLSAVVRGMIDREALHQALNLSEKQRVLVELAVGYKPVTQ